MEGKTCIVTGANSGIGEVTTRELARMGADVVMICRSEDKARAAVARIKEEVPDAKLEVLLADMSSLAAVRKVAAEFLASHDKLDVLVNNAGIYLPKRFESVDGFEMTFATNHLGPFLLTNLLLDVLAATGGARVVNVSSEGHRQGRLNFDDLQAEKRFNGIRVYCTSKLLNVYFSNELARRAAERGITSNSLHPGAIASGFAQDEPGAFKWLMKLGSPFLISPEKGAQTQIYLASSPDVADVTGEYYAKSRAKRPAGRSLDADAGVRLWDVSAELVGL
jgi:retinol dehydrogenase 12